MTVRCKFGKNLNRPIYEQKCELHKYTIQKQESPAVTDKPARRESMPKMAPIRRAYNVVADNTGLSIFIRLAVVASEICEIPRNSLQIQSYRVQGHARSSILVSMESPYVTFY